jgi:flagellar basal-body rod protein FlgC
MVSSFYSSISGMRAAFSMMDVSAHNTANLNTDGFKKQTVQLSEADKGGVTVTIGQSTAPGPTYQGPGGKIIEASNADPAEEIISQITAKYLLAANVAAFKKAADMEKSIIDILG